jgi:hypothetical protein
MSTVVLTIGLLVDFTVGSTVGSTVGLTWLCWAMDLSKSFDSSDERLNKIVFKTWFTSFIK